MNALENKMLQTLIDLKKNHHAIGIKAEFEAEGTKFEEALRLKEIANLADLDLTIKVGGCEALRDMHDARTIGIKNLVAPMIESSYALQKYIRAIQIVFSCEERKYIKFFINIETINGINNLDEILNTKEAELLDGIVFGRSDMCGSLGIPSSEINSEKIFFYAQEIAQKTYNLKKEFVIGGRVNNASLPFLNQLPKEYLTKFETRKVIFDAQKALSDKNIETGIEKALEFELMWLKNKLNYNETLADEDLKRIEILKEGTEKVQILQI
ncbi:MAG: aldolase/citrate lyase family protein [bacterium]